MDVVSAKYIDEARASLGMKGEFPYLKMCVFQVGKTHVTANSSTAKVLEIIRNSLFRVVSEADDKFHDATECVPYSCRGLVRVKIQRRCFPNPRLGLSGIEMLS